jgi:hypothetical protein
MASAKGYIFCSAQPDFTHALTKGLP